MTKRAKLLAALAVAVALVVGAPLSAFAYWAVSAQLALTAQAATFSLAPVTVGPASAASSTSFVGPTSAPQYYSAPLKNNGATPWASQAVTVTPASGFGDDAEATLKVAFTTDVNACHNPATFNAVVEQNALAASSWSSNTPVATNGIVYACVRVEVKNTDTHTNGAQQASERKLTLSISTTVAQQNWTAQQAVGLDVKSTGWATCSTSGDRAVLTLPQGTPTGPYTVERADTGARVAASTSNNVLTLTNPATWPTRESTDSYVTVKNAQGTVVATAKLGFRSSVTFVFLFTKNLECA